MWEKDYLPCQLSGMQGETDRRTDWLGFPFNCTHKHTRTKERQTEQEKERKKNTGQETAARQREDRQTGRKE
jgi:hypothetical protein